MKSFVKRALLASPARRVLEPRFAILGTGRSGTRYIADVLTEAGVNTGHEAWWNPVGVRRLRLDGDASWCATFALDGYQGHVFHQVRNTIRVVESMVAFGVAPHRINRTWPQYRRNWVTFSGDPIIDAMNVVDTWLTEAERRAHWTWRVEDVDADLIIRIGDRIGRPVSDAKAQHALAAVSRSTNRQSAERDSNVRLGWDDLPKGDLKDRLQRHAERFGYL